jgi:hypothetical protein
VWNESLWVVGVSGSWEKILLVDLCDFPIVLAKPSNPLPDGVLFEFGGDPLLSLMRSVV